MTAIRKLRGLSRPDRRLLYRAWASLVCARFAVSLLSLPQLRRPRYPAPRQGASPERIAWALRVASRFVPRATCLVQALAAHRLLARHGRPSTLRIGVAKSPAEGFQAHAWVECDGRILIGESDTQYEPLLAWTAAEWSPTQ